MTRWQTINACSLRHMWQELFFYFFWVHFNLFVAFGGDKGAWDYVMLVETRNHLALTFIAQGCETRACILEGGVANEHLVFSPVSVFLESPLVLCGLGIESCERWVFLGHGLNVVERWLLSTQNLLYYSLVVSSLLLAYVALRCDTRCFSLGLIGLENMGSRHHRLLKPVLRPDGLTCYLFLRIFYVTL